MNPKSTSSFVLPSPKTTRPWLDACIAAACLFAATVNLIPQAQDAWSRATFPSLAAVDRQLEPYGITFLPDRLPKDMPSRPMMAVIFGSFLPEPAEKVAPLENLPEEVSVVPIAAPTIPAAWRKADLPSKFDSGIDCQQPSPELFDLP